MCIAVLTFSVTLAEKQNLRLLIKPPESKVACVHMALLVGVTRWSPQDIYIYTTETVYYLGTQLTSSSKRHKVAVLFVAHEFSTHATRVHTGDSENDRNAYNGVCCSLARSTKIP